MHLCGTCAQATFESAETALGRSDWRHMGDFEAGLVTQVGVLLVAWFMSGRVLHGGQVWEW